MAQAKTTKTTTARRPAAKKPPVRASELAAPVRHVTIGGVDYPLEFSNKAFRILEDVYETEYNKPIGVYEILQEVAQPRHRAVEAFVYAAAAAHGYDKTFTEFDQGFKLTDIEGMLDVLTDGVLAAMPDAPESEKNA